jgi:hypothetical protein
VFIIVPNAFLPPAQVYRNRYFRLLGLCRLLLLFVAAGCTPATAVPQATPAASEVVLLALPSPVAMAATTAQAAATATPRRTATPQATATPTPTTTRQMTATAQATARATLIPTVSPTPPKTGETAATIAPAAPEPAWQATPGTNPFTGERVANPALLERRPIAVKVSNYPPQVRPQYGLNQADLIFEHYAEAGVTRFTALFYGRDAERVGSIRSGRLIDLEIPVMYDAAFAYSGAVGPIRLLIRDSAFFNRVISPDFAHGGFFRVEEEGKAFEHTLYTSTFTLRRMLEARGEEKAPQLRNGMSFQAEAPPGGTAASRLEIRYLGANAFWQYNHAGGRYTRWTDGRPHLDAATGRQLSFRNVVVLSAHHQETDIVEDRGGNLSVQIQIWGEGPVSVFRDGRRYDGRWRRLDAGHMLTFYDLEGNPLPLAPGNTFFQLVPLGFTGLVASP